MPSVRKDTRQFYSPCGEFYCFAVLLLLCTVVLSFGQFLANKITLKPQDFNITFDLSKI